MLDLFGRYMAQFSVPLSWETKKERKREGKKQRAIFDFRPLHLPLLSFRLSPCSSVCFADIAGQHHFVKELQ
jgi:hypothetical protein